MRALNTSAWLELEARTSASNCWRCTRSRNDFRRGADIAHAKRPIIIQRT